MWKAPGRAAHWFWHMLNELPPPPKAKRVPTPAVTPPLAAPALIFGKPRVDRHRRRPR